MPTKEKRAARRQRKTVEIDEAAIRLHIKALKGGGYLATSPDVPGLVAEGRSVTEAAGDCSGANPEDR